ncbi:methyltransferase domain-containing protein [Algivirga pacifica]|uniref:Methyltransferase domain-containing protein n=1 Tax=Algivirga pacifica TaxID=1162670 RepID=A0ABP9DGA5_9BACT
MLLFRQRSEKKELLDAPDIPRDALFRNLQELDTINQQLGGYEVVLKGLQQLLESIPKGQTIRILDIGSGGGDTLKQVYLHLHQQYDIALTGVDLKEDCIVYAKQNTAGLPITWIQSDYRVLLSQQEHPPFDIIITSLFCHHLDNPSMVELLTWMKKHARIGFVINDLHRHFLAYYSIQWLTRLFSRSYLVKHDAPLSVLRAFRKKELLALCQQANITHVQLQWKWAFRWLMIGRHENV